MKKIVVLGLLAGFVGAAGCAGSGQSEHSMTMAKAKAPYVLKGEEVEGCECTSVCPCVFANDDTFGDCRGTIAWHIKEGHYGSTDLSGISFAVALLKTGKNVTKAMGKWEGVIYVSSKATPEQKAAIVDFASTNWGKAFAKVEVKSEPIDFHMEANRFEVKIGKIAVLKTAPLKGADGKAPAIEHAAFALIPVLHCATSVENTYADGAGNTWDFKERNAFFGPFSYSGE